VTRELSDEDDAPRSEQEAKGSEDERENQTRDCCENCRPPRSTSRSGGDHTGEVVEDDCGESEQDEHDERDSTGFACLPPVEEKTREREDRTRDGGHDAGDDTQDEESEGDTEDQVDHRSRFDSPRL